MAKSNSTDQVANISLDTVSAHVLDAQDEISTGLSSLKFLCSRHDLDGGLQAILADVAGHFEMASRQLDGISSIHKE